MNLTIRPISDRTAFTGRNRQASAFRVSYAQVLELLDRELEFLDGKDAVLEVDINESDLRLDGLIRADARAASPGVRLAFDSSVGPLVYATDVFYRDATSYLAPPDADGKRKRRETMRHDWQHNLYAIAKSLEALRMVDRYGVTKRGEQYTGFKALPAGRAMPASHMTREAAIALLAGYVDVPPEHLNLEPESLRYTWRRARRKTHPDHNGGDRSKWDLVQAAGRVLGIEP